MSAADSVSEHDAAAAGEAASAGHDDLQSAHRAAAEAGSPQGFAALDRWLAQRAQSAPWQGGSQGLSPEALGGGRELGGFAVVTCDSRSHEAIAEHVARRMIQRSPGAKVLRSTSSEANEGFRDVLLGISRASSSSAPRLRAVGVDSGTGAGSASAPAYSARELATKLHQRLCEQATAGLASVAGLVVVDAQPSRFSQTVAAELEALLAPIEASADRVASPIPVVWIVSWSPEGRGARSSVQGNRFDIDGQLDAAALEAWWSSAAARPEFEDAVRLEQLERWWRGARAAARRAHAQPDASSAALAGPLRASLRTLLLAARPWPLSRIASLGLDAQAIEQLAQADVVDVRDGYVTVGSAWASDLRTLPSLDEQPAAVCAEEANRIAAALATVFPGDPWAAMRAAEVAHAAGLVERGDELSLSALTSVLDPEARIDFWTRFLAGSPAPTPSAERLLPFVDVALRSGDGEFGLRLARDAVAVDGANPRVLLAMGRALAASGDLTAAALTLARVSADLTSDIQTRSRAWVEIADVRYFSSDLTGARCASLEALTLCCVEPGSLPKLVGAQLASCKLDARNVLGKVLLAEGQFALAEQHFAEDACDASLAAEPVGELRARVNRAISLMSVGRRGEAQGMLETVLAEGEALGELKAVGIALINLAALAILDHRYGEALELSERAVDVLRRIGDKNSLARCVANLAELRVRVGLFDEATQAVRFGARVFRGGPPPAHAAEFALILARVALARGDSAAAFHQVAQALAPLGVQLPGMAGSSQVEAAAPGEASQGAALALSRGPDRGYVSEGFRLAARVAIDDGDTLRAALLIERAAAERAPARARADLVTLRALLARALGAPFESLAAEALVAAREADDDALLREAHSLLLRASLDRGDTAAARHHLDSALAVRDRVLEGLPTSLRAIFLARRDVRALDRQADALAAQQLAAQQEAEVFGAPPSLSPRSAGSWQPPASGPVSSGPASSGVASRGFSSSPSAPPPGARRIVGEDPAVRSLFNAIRKVGPADATVLIHGESGTGKELVAEALHEASGRKAGPLVKVNCAALVETLLLSELFGHEKGAFTGAASRRRGRFEAADGGTLFLDEIGDISARTQVALLRVLQERSFERVGGSTAIHANVRVVCATHRDLATLVQRGEFREDLYYRLCGVVLEVPALRNRLGDLGAIASAILDRVAEERGGPVKRLSARALRALRSHTWPGNVRELENALRAASLFAEGELLEPEDFADNVESLRHISETVEAVPQSLAPASGPAFEASGTEPASSSVVSARPSVVYPPGPVSVSEGSTSIPGGEGAPSGTPSEVAYAQVRAGVSLHDMKRLIERDCIARALSDAGGNITRAATLLGMKRPRLSQLVKQYGLGLDGASDSFEDNGSSSFEDNAAEEE